MIARISLKINDCLKCPKVYTKVTTDPDGSDPQVSAFCKKAAGLYDDDIRPRFICGERTLKTAPVPVWCPYIMEGYFRLITDAYKSDSVIRQKVELSRDVLSYLEKYWFNGFIYESKIHPSVRDSCLIRLAGDSEYARSQGLETREKNLDNEEDYDIVKAAVKKDYEGNIKEYIKKFNEVKKEASERKRKAELKPKLAIPMIYYLADTIVVGCSFDANQKVKFKFIPDGDEIIKEAELKYYVPLYDDEPGDYLAVIKKCEGKKQGFLSVKRILKEFFGVKTFTLYVNNYKIPLSKL